MTPPKIIQILIYGDVLLGLAEDGQIYSGEMGYFAVRNQIQWAKINNMFM